MKRQTKIIAVIAILVLIGGGIAICMQDKSTQSEKVVKTVVKKVAAEESSSVKFDYVKPPMTINTQKGAVEYLIVNFWNNFDFRDTLFISEKVELEQAISNYILYLSLGEIESSRKSISAFIESSHQNTDMHFAIIDGFINYISNPNSPMRNEMLHILFLEALVADAKTDDTEKIAHKYNLKQVSKNMVGSRATNFDYNTREGAKGSLHALKGEYTLLMFYNIGCAACAETVEELTNNVLINDMVASKSMVVLAIKSDDEPWEDSKIPTTWIDSRDRDGVIDKEVLYHIPAIPSLYLLDANKRVVLKDVTPSDIIKFLNK